MNNMRTTLLLAGLTGLLLLAGQAMGGQQGLIIALLFAGAMNIGSYWFSDKIVLKLYKARPAGSREAPVLHDVVRELASRARLPMPKVYVIPNDAPNAFATGRNPEHAAVAQGAAICGNPLWLSSALRKLGQANQRIPMQATETHPASAHLFIVNPLKGANMAQLFSTHPPLQERIRRLEHAAYGRV